MIGQENIKSINEPNPRQESNVSQSQSPTIKEESKLIKTHSLSYEEKPKISSHSDVDTNKNRDAKRSPSQNSLDDNWQKFSSKKKKEKRQETPIQTNRPENMVNYFTAYYHYRYQCKCNE